MPRVGVAPLDAEKVSVLGQQPVSWVSSNAENFSVVVRIWSSEVSWRRMPPTARVAVWQAVWPRLKMASPLHTARECEVLDRRPRVLGDVDEEKSLAGPAVVKEERGVLAVSVFCKEHVLEARGDSTMPSVWFRISAGTS